MDQEGDDRGKARQDEAGASAQQVEEAFAAMPSLCLPGMLAPGLLVAIEQAPRFRVGGRVAQPQCTGGNAPWAGPRFVPVHGVRGQQLADLVSLVVGHVAQVEQQFRHARDHIVVRPGGGRASVTLAAPAHPPPMTRMFRLSRLSVLPCLLSVLLLAAS